MKIEIPNCKIRLKESAVFADRQAALDDYAADVKRSARTAWRKQATVAVEFAGPYGQSIGDSISRTLRGSGSLIPGSKKIGEEQGAFNCLFSAHRKYA